MTLVRYYPRHARNEVRARAAAWTPAVDVNEHEDTFDLTLDLPGIKKEDLKITVKEGKLFLTGERKRPDHDTNEKYYNYYERPYGTFERSFKLPEHVDADKIKASFSDGELHVVVPKLEKARPRTIKVS